MRLFWQEVEETFLSICHGAILIPGDIEFYSPLTTKSRQHSVQLSYNHNNPVITKFACEICNKAADQPLHPHNLSHVFGISDQARLKPACLATEASYSLDILDLSSINTLLPKQRTTKVLIRLRDAQADLHHCCPHKV